MYSNQLVISFLIIQFFSTIINAQPKIILDTDFGGDADDLGALAMLHNYIDKDKCELLAIMSWSDEQYAVSGIDAVNRFYNHPNIPIGCRKAPITRLKRCYGEIISSNFPHELNNISAHNATSLYRDVLSKSKNKSVVIITIGPLKNIENLLLSKKDEISELTGSQLIKRKVKEIVIMGGEYPETNWEWNFSGNMNGVTKRVLKKISIPVTFIGAELGSSVKTGKSINKINHNTPLYKGFIHFSKYAPWINKNFKGKILENSTFDQLAILYAVENGVGLYWDKVYNSHCIPDENGGNIWIKKKYSNHSYLQFTVSSAKMGIKIDSLMLDNPKTKPTN